MHIQFKTDRLEKQCNKRKECIKQWGERRSKLIGRRLDDLRAAVTLEDMRHAPGDCHNYRHRKDHTFTLDLDGGWRLFFKPLHDPPPLLADNISLDWKQVTAIMITEITDPHE